jgi:hypothetical protein
MPALRAISVTPARFFARPSSVFDAEAEAISEAYMATRSNYANISRNLTVAFPIGFLVGDTRIVSYRLDIAGGVDRARGYAMLARRGYTEGFSHFVTSMTAPVTSGWSGCRLGLPPLESAAFARRTRKAVM